MFGILYIVTNGSPNSLSGDIILLSRYCAELEGLYRTIMISTMDFIKINIDSDDVVLIANLDIPEKIFPVIEKVYSSGAGLLLYTLFHPPEAIRGFFYYRSGFHKLIPRRASDIICDALKTIDWIRRVFSSPYFLGIVKVAGFSKKRLQVWCLQRSRAILVSSTLEKMKIESCFSIYDRVHVCPHVPNKSKGEGIHKQADYILVPGRVEKRKNVLQVLRAIMHFPDERFVFIGSKLDETNRYQKAFIKQLCACSNVTYIDGLPLEQFNDYLYSSKLIVSASWFEVMSLIDVDALNAGIPVVSTSNSYLPDCSLVYKCHPDDVDSIYQAIRNALARHDICSCVFRLAGKSITTVVKEIRAL